MSNALVLFMKAPIPGTVKTRLAPRVTMDEAAELYRAFILDTLDLAQRTTVDVLFVAWTPDGGREELGFALGDPDVNWLRQRGIHLGERLSNAFTALRRDGWEKTIVLGGDSPLLPLDYVEEAFEALDRHDVVLGPSDDGGYYLIGLGGPGSPAGSGIMSDPGIPGDPNVPGEPERRRHTDGRFDRLFESIHWGTDRVLRQTRAAIRACGLSSHELPAWHDVDRPADLDRLAREIRALRAKGDLMTGRFTETALDTVNRGGRNR